MLLLLLLLLLLLTVTSVVTVVTTFAPMMTVPTANESLSFLASSASGNFSETTPDFTAGSKRANYTSSSNLPANDSSVAGVLTVAETTVGPLHNGSIIVSSAEKESYWRVATQSPEQRRNAWTLSYSLTTHVMRGSRLVDAERVTQEPPSSAYLLELMANISCNESGTIAGYDCYWLAANNVSEPNTTAAADPLPDGLAYWALLLVIVPLLTVFGNILIVLSVFKERSLRTATNYFIVSLAVADIMVAVLVMPLAVYVEVYQSVWLLGDGLCDTWVAFDVMCCTASILNLTAISVDRFIAVTRPLQYAKHKNSKRFYVMVALVWVVSIVISMPIAFSMNYTPRRESTPKLCVFYNADFLIYSSMGSFYIPCVIMVLLYWRIFLVIRRRSRRAAQQKKRAREAQQARQQISCARQPAVNRTTSDASATEDNSQRELLPPGKSVAGGDLLRTPITEETSFTNYNAKLTPTDTDEAPSGVCDGAEASRQADSSEEATSSNDKSVAIQNAPAENNHNHDDCATGYVSPDAIVVEMPSKGTAAGNGRGTTNFLQLPSKNNGIKVDISRMHTPKSHSVMKFNFRLRHSKKKKERSANRRERKATKTLAIVLGVFLLCWVPFFTINIINSICIRYELFHLPECKFSPVMFSFFVWLGYMNSFLNPVIYTIFNNDFRRAFKKLLQNPCH